MRSLTQIAVGQTATVKALNGDGPLRRRIMDMGLTRGTDVKVVKIAPLGDPIELSVRGYDLSIRRTEADKIMVE